MDSAFKTAPYNAYTTAELRAWLRDANFQGNADSVVSEIARRDAVAAGDISQMTQGERLRHAKRNK